MSCHVTRSSLLYLAMGQQKRNPPRTPKAKATPKSRSPKPKPKPKATPPKRKPKGKAKGKAAKRSVVEVEEHVELEAQAVTQLQTDGQEHEHEGHESETPDLPVVEAVEEPPKKKAKSETKQGKKAPRYTFTITPASVMEPVYMPTRQSTLAWQAQDKNRSNSIVLASLPPLTSASTAPRFKLPTKQSILRLSHGPNAAPSEVAVVPFESSESSTEEYTARGPPSEQASPSSSMQVQQPPPNEKVQVEETQLDETMAEAERERDAPAAAGGGGGVSGDPFGQAGALCFFFLDERKKYKKQLNKIIMDSWTHGPIDN